MGETFWQKTQGERFMLGLNKLLNIFGRKKSSHKNSAEVVRKRLDELKLVVTYPEQQKYKMDVDEFQQALVNFICDQLELPADKVNFTIHKRGDQAICNMTVAIPDENMA